MCSLFSFISCDVKTKMTLVVVFFFKQNTEYEMRISDWSSDVCSSDLALRDYTKARRQVARLVNEIEVLDFEIYDAEDFIRHLKQSLSDFDDSSVTFFALGHLAFEYCPSCFAPVEPKSEEHTSELQSLLRNSYAVFCLKKKNKTQH